MIHLMDLWLKLSGLVSHFSQSRHSLIPLPLVEGEKNTALELDGRKFATGDSGAPMLCNLLCKMMGRHVHAAACRTEDGEECQEEGVEHVQSGGTGPVHDWITHRLFWARSGEWSSVILLASNNAHRLG